MMALLQRFLPEVSSLSTSGPWLLLYSLAVAFGVGWLKKHTGMRTAYTRKIFHFFIFSLAGVLHLWRGSQMVSLFGIITVPIVLVGVFLGEKSWFYRALARPKDAPHQAFFVLVPLFTTALGGIFSNLLFPSFAYIGYFAGGWGDAIGEPVGACFGKHPYKVSSPLGVSATRTIEGSLAVCGVSVFITALALVFSGYPLMQIAIASCAVGVGVMLVEAVSTHGFDNLTIQVAASGIAWMLLR